MAKSNRLVAAFVSQFVQRSGTVWASNHEVPVRDLTIQTTSHPSGLIIRISGDAGVDNVGTMETELTRLAAQRPPLVVFDLARLDFIASLGMGALMAFRKGIVRNGGIVRIAAARSAVLDAFKRAALRELFNTCDTVDEALTAHKPHAM